MSCSASPLSQDGATNHLSRRSTDYASIEESGTEPHTKTIGRNDPNTICGTRYPAETIAEAVAEPGGGRALGTIPNRLESIRKMTGKQGSVKDIRTCYEAGLTRCMLYWQITELGVECEIVAPTLVPVKAATG